MLIHAPIKVKGFFLDTVFGSMSTKEWFVYYDDYDMIPTPINQLWNEGNATTSTETSTPTDTYETETSYPTE